jgi:type I restriction enzyme S subunit
MATLQPYKKYNSVAYDYATELPDGWQLLPNIAIFQERIDRGYINEELLSITIGKGVIKQTDVDIKKDSSNEDKSKYKLIKVGDIAYNKMRMWQGALGYSDYQGISSPAYVILKPKMKISPRFFHYMFRSNFYTNYSKRFSYGIVDDQLSLRYTDFKRMYSIVPPLEVQNSIVAYLDKKNSVIDKFIRNKERLVELLEEHKNGIINQTIIKGLDNNTQTKHTEFDWLGEIPLNWKVKKLRFLGSFQNGVSEGADYFGSGFPFVSYGDVYNNTVLPTQIDNLAKSSKADRIRFSVKEDDVFFTRTSETIEEIGFSSTCYNTIENGNFSGFLIRFRPKQNLLFKGYSKYYFRSNLHRRYFVKEMNLVTRASLSQDLLKNLPVILPSLIEQKEIAKYLDIKMSEINLAISKAQKEISSIKEYREALITDLVTGKRSVQQV